MKEQVEAFLVNLLRAGFSREQLNERGYDYALTLQTDALQPGEYVPSAMKLRAAELLVQALPEAYRTYEIRNRMR